MSDQIVEWAKELQSLAQVGLFYGKDIYDRERYQRIREISTEMMACRTGIPTETITDLFCGDVGYQVNHPIHIGSNCWIGVGAIILAGITIGDNTVIGAGSVVTKDIPANVVAVGNPCRIIKSLI